MGVSSWALDLGSRSLRYWVLDWVLDGFTEVLSLRPLYP